MVKHELDNLKLSGYYPGVIGKITELHAIYYFENWGFDASFETQVARELSAFISEFRPGGDGFWAALVNGVFAGSVAIDGSLSGGLYLHCDAQDNDLESLQCIVPNPTPTDHGGFISATNLATISWNH